MEAFLGKYNLSDENETGSSSHSISKIIIHPDWRYIEEKFDADIAILKLDNAAYFDTFARPVCLPEQSNNAITSTGLVAGWGKTENSESFNEFTPFEVPVPVIDDAVCYTTVPKLGRYSSPRMFCGGFVNQGKAVCKGDSGGGFFTRDERSIWTLRGIVSGGLQTASGGCEVNAYSLYTNVAKFRNWITEIMQRVKVVFSCRTGFEEFT